VDKEWFDEKKKAIQQFEIETLWLILYKNV
jgi:hypothetical protein